MRTAQDTARRPIRAETQEIMNDLGIFLSYNLSNTEMVVVWRLQTLAAAHGITLYVPHPEDRRGDRLSKSTAQMIDASNLVVAFCTRQFSQRVLQEINYAIQSSKPALLILEKGIEPPSRLRTLSVINFDPERPGDLEKHLIEHLNEHKTKYQLKKREANAVGVLFAIGVGLLVLWLLTNKDQ